MNSRIFLFVADANMSVTSFNAPTRSQMSAIGAKTYLISGRILETVLRGKIGVDDGKKGTQKK